MTGPICWCCAHITRAGDTKPRHTRARYEWTPRLSGNRILLCVTCCAAWRVNASDDPDLEPARIRELAKGATSSHPSGPTRWPTDGDGHAQ